VEQLLLTTELRRLRQERGTRAEEVAEALEWNLQQFTLVETWENGATVEALEQLLAYYDVPSPRRAALRDRAMRVSAPAWWSDFNPGLDDPALFRYLEFEPASESLYAFECMTVPALLQTSSYARVMLSEYYRNVETEWIESLVRLRMERQRLMREREPAIHQVYVVSEEALSRHMGSTEIMVAQLDHLLELSERAEVTLQVLPLDVTCAAFIGPFWLLELPVPYGHVLHLERTPSSKTYVGTSPETGVHRVRFSEFQEKALDGARSRALLVHIRDRLASRD
jgi:transcriptional regulator with XRE-family HTH domain